MESTYGLGRLSPVEVDEAVGVSIGTTGTLCTVRVSGSVGFCSLVVTCNSSWRVGVKWVAIKYSAQSRGTEMVSAVWGISDCTSCWPDCDLRLLVAFFGDNTSVMSVDADIMLFQYLSVLGT